MLRVKLALFPEGSIDAHFLPPLIQRTAQKLLNKEVEGPIPDAEKVEIVPKQPGNRRADCILSAARYAHDYYDCHALIVHSDADDKKPDRALAERIQPGFALVAASREDVCKHLIPIVPVHMIEAWMLADHEALREALGTTMSPQNLGLPKLIQVERDANPKQTLKEIIAKSQAQRSKRHSHTDLSDLYMQLGEKIDLAILSHVLSYKKFEQDLKQTLADLDFILLDDPPHSSKKGKEKK